MIYPDIDPVAFHLGPLAVHWYGLMYLVGILSAWWIALRRRALLGDDITADHIGDLVFYCAMGVVLGGRLGYMLVYGWSSMLENPLNLFKIWQGGMSFHGGCLGVFCAVAWFGYRHKKSWFLLMDFIAPLAPIGLGLGRLGNFINGELWGRPSELPWAMVFSHVDALPRHPSTLYEMFLEGVVLSLLLWWFVRKPRPLASVSALFLVGYGLARFFVEYFREPDVQMGYLWGHLTTGQWLSAPMVLWGVFLWYYAMKREKVV